MYHIILCEGETDAILISYYLSNSMNFKYVKNIPKELPRLNNINKHLSWYRDNNMQYLTICSIGGCDFESSVNEIMKYNKNANDDSIFFRIALVMDHDDESTENTIDLIGKSLNMGNSLLAGEWQSFNYQGGFENILNGEIVCILQPDKEYGALETFVLQMLCQNDDDNKKVVSQVKDFINHFSSQKYLKHRRDKTKAELSVSLSIMYPDKNFIKFIIRVIKFQFTTAFIFFI